MKHIVPFLSLFLFAATGSFAAFPTPAATSPTPAASPSPAVKDAPPVDTEALLKALKQIKTEHKTIMKTSLSSVIQQVNAAASSDMNAISLYEQANKATRFGGEINSAGMFAKWKKRETAHLQKPATKMALRMRMIYLSISLQKAAGAKPGDLEPQLWSYIKELYTNSKQLSDERKILDKSIVNSAVARWLQCDSYLANLKDWGKSPGNALGIFQKSFLPLLRETNDPQINSYWDAIIQMESGEVAAGKKPSEITHFNFVEKPSMLWDRAQDMLAIGERNAAISAMFQLIKTYPAHPDAHNWITSLQDVLQGASGQAASTQPTPESPATTSATPAAAPAKTPSATPSPAATPHKTYKVFDKVDDQN